MFRSRIFFPGYYRLFTSICPLYFVNDLGICWFALYRTINLIPYLQFFRSGSCSSCYFILKESIGGWQLLAVILICTGVVGLAVVEKRQSDAIRAARREVANVKYTSSVLAIIFPILYCILDALGTFADAYWLEMFIEETQANMAYEFTFLAMAIFGFIYVVIIKKQKIIIAQEKAKIAAGICETAGQFAYIFAIGAMPILAAPAISSYCVFSVLWSRIFLKEKLSRAHYIVISLVLVGIVILGIFDV